MTGPLEDRDYLKRQKQRLEDAQYQRTADLQALLESGQGRRFLWWVIDELCHVGAISYREASSRASDFLEGERNVGVTLNHLCASASPKGYAQMQAEKLSEMVKRAQEARPPETVPEEGED